MSRCVGQISYVRPTCLITTGVVLFLFVWPLSQALGAPPTHNKGTSHVNIVPPQHVHQTPQHTPQARIHTPSTGTNHGPITPFVPGINIVPQGGYNPGPQTYLPGPSGPGVGVTNPGVIRIPANQLPPVNQPVASLKPNLPPDLVPQPVALKPNFQMAALAISYEDLQAAQAAIQDEQQQKLDQIKDGLGPDMLADPAVAAAIDTIQAKIDNGEEVTDGDIDAVNTAVATALTNGVPITGGINAATANQALGNIQTLSQVQQAIGQYPPDGGSLPMPSGLIDMILNPLLPADATYALPSGAVMDGTGGQGGFAMGQGTLAEAMGLPAGVGTPVPAALSDPNDRATSGLLIMNPSRNKVGVEYIVNDQNYSIPSGYNQRIPGTGTWLVQFNRGPGFGDARYSLTEGTYYWATIERGWELYVREFSVTLSNADNPKTFEYIVDNTPVSLAGGQSRTHTSKYPITIRFDRGGGNEPGQKQFNDATVGKFQVKVAVNTVDNLWDLYPARNFVAAPAETQPGTQLARAAGETATPGPRTVQFTPVPAAKQSKLKITPPSPKQRKVYEWPMVAKKATTLPTGPVPEQPAPGQSADKP